MKIYPIELKGDPTVDDNLSDASSSISSDPENDIKNDLKLNAKNATIKLKNELKSKVLEEVLREVMPDLGAYNIDGMVRARAVDKDGYWIQFLQAIGYKELDLHDAVLGGQINKVQQTVRVIMTGKKANPLLINQYNKDGKTALSLAVKSNLTSIALFLLSKRALPDICDEFTGCTPLMYSVLQSNREISRALLSAGAFVDLADFKCVTPLMLAASKDDVYHCQLLCDQNADVDLQDINGWTALHYCAYANSPKACYYLLTEAASRSVRDLNRRRALDIAKFKNHSEIIAILSDFKF